MGDFMKKIVYIAMLLALFTHISANTDQLKKSYPKAITFIQEELQKSGLNPEQVLIASSKQGWAMGAKVTHNGIRDVVHTDEHCLFAPETGSYSLKDLESTLEKENTERIASYQFIINHEANHALYKHSLKRAFAELADCGISIVTIAGIIHTGIHTATTHLSTFSRTTLHLAALVLEYIALCKTDYMHKGGLLTNAYARMLEQEADDKIRNNDAILKGGITYFKQYKKSNTHTTMSMQIKQFIQDIYETHPTIESRIAALESRIATLKA